MLGPLLKNFEERLARREDPFRRTVPFAIDAQKVFPGAEENLGTFLNQVERATQDRPAFFNQIKAPPMNQTSASVAWTNEAGGGLPCLGEASADYYPAQDAEELVIIVPHLNSEAADYRSMAKILNLFGRSALRYVLPFHEGATADRRHPIDQLVSASLGTTLGGVRQAVVELVALADHFQSRGYRRIHLVGISVGCCISIIAAAVSTHFQTLNLLLMADDFSSVVWRGRATPHLRQELEGKISFPDLQAAWDLLHPYRHAGLLAARPLPVHMITGRCDTVMPPDLAENVAAHFTQAGVNLAWQRYACGHYTFGWPPFNIAALWSVLQAIKAR